MKFGELIHVSINFSSDKPSHNLDDDLDPEPFHGFSTQDRPTKTALSVFISEMGASIPKTRGRPKKYQDYIDYKTPQSSQVQNIESRRKHRDILLHGYVQEDMDDDYDEYELCVTVPMDEHISIKSPIKSDVSSSEVEFYSDNDESSTQSIPPNYISSDDDPFLHDTEPWWDSPSSPSHQHDRGKYRSETDPHFLHRAQIVSTDSSSLESLCFDTTLVDTPSSPGVSSHDTQSRVFDFSNALDALNSAPLEDVVNLDNLPQPTPLPRLRASSRPKKYVDYKHLHNHGHTE